MINDTWYLINNLCYTDPVKKQTAIIVFYTAYFLWLLIIAYVSPETDLVNLFTGIIVAFYFVYLKEVGDVQWFLATATMVTIYLFYTGTLYFDDFLSLNNLVYIPIWIPLAWGTTIVALRKFYLKMNKGVF